MSMADMIDERLVSFGLDVTKIKKMQSEKSAK